ncbi:cytochrome c [Hahella sp. HN01]|uniref:c-type cytochrome n=1 Tax=Hahella sp. HN01 TaxID=2847262 RepID=UPI001C1ECC11|nr:cytochrome c [Hahella sp. HN01]MBU6955635.1 cytochrome c [Hahella sp. HN01]
MLKLITSSALGVFLAVMSNVSQSADAEAGKARAAVCAACHGANGKATIPMYPNLAGQNEQYLLGALKAYKNKERTGAQAIIMQGQVAALSDEDLANLAAYFANLKQ